LCKTRRPTIALKSDFASVRDVANRFTSAPTLAETVALSYRDDEFLVSHLLAAKDRRVTDRLAQPDRDALLRCEVRGSDVSTALRIRHRTANRVRREDPANAKVVDTNSLVMQAASWSHSDTWPAFWRTWRDELAGTYRWKGTQHPVRRIGFPSDRINTGNCGKLRGLMMSDLAIRLDSDFAGITPG
jgi:hypothetical protein